MGYLPTDGLYGTLEMEDMYPTRFSGLSMLPNPYRDGDTVVWMGLLEADEGAGYVPLAAKTVDIKRNGTPFQSVVTGADGSFSHDRVVGASHAGTYTVEYAGE